MFLALVPDLLKSIIGEFLYLRFSINILSASGTKSTDKCIKYLSYKQHLLNAHSLKPRLIVRSLLPFRVEYFFLLCLLYTVSYRITLQVTRECYNIDNLSQHQMVYTTINSENIHIIPFRIAILYKEKIKINLCLLSFFIYTKIIRINFIVLFKSLNSCDGHLWN